MSIKLRYYSLLICIGIIFYDNKISKRIKIEIRHFKHINTKKLKTFGGRSRCTQFQIDLT